MFDVQVRDGAEQTRSLRWKWTGEAEDAVLD